MPIERQSEQFGIFEDLPMPERTASVSNDVEGLRDLLSGPAILAGLNHREAISQDQATFGIGIKNFDRLSGH